MTVHDLVKAIRVPYDGEFANLVAVADFARFSL